MDEAIANVRSSQGHEAFDDLYLTELCVKQKYMGHRNARYDIFLIFFSTHQIKSIRRTIYEIYASKFV